MRARSSQPPSQDTFQSASTQSEAEKTLVNSIHNALDRVEQREAQNQSVGNVVIDMDRPPPELGSDALRQPTASMSVATENLSQLPAIPRKLGAQYIAYIKSRLLLSS